MLIQWLRRRFRDISILGMTMIMLSFLTACGGGGGGITLLTPSPEQVAAMSGDQQVTVYWSEVVGATSYNIYWSNTAPVTKSNGSLIANATSPYVHHGLTNGLTYYYVITAVGPTGESAESPQVSAVPQVPPPSAPTNVTAILTPETTKSVTIQWDPPTASSGPLTYNLYRSTSPGVALRLTDTTTTKIVGVVSPHIDLVPAGQVTYYYVVTAVDGGIEGDPSAEVSATPRGSPTGGGDSGYGNNLSVPLVFANGLGISGAVITGSDHTDLATGLRPIASDITDPFPYFNPNDIYLLGGVTPYYEQQSSSTWQANWLNGQAATQYVMADWGDNLGNSASLSQNQVIRVEMVLYQDKGVSASWSIADSMLGYNMALLYGEGILEMQGTDTTTYDATRRRVFAVNSRLKIEKLVGGVPTTHPCGFDGSVAEGMALPDGTQLAKFGSEINVGGALTYGFNWKLSQCNAPDKAGDWRITFSLDDTADVNGTSYPNNTLIDGTDPSNPTAVLVNPQTTYVDVTII